MDTLSIKEHLETERRIKKVVVLSQLSGSFFEKLRPVISYIVNRVNLVKVAFIILSFLSILHIDSWNAYAQTTYYVRAGATGANNGSDWKNAYTSFSAAGLNSNSSTAPRGNTYYVATGNYGTVRFRNNESGTSVITIKKAVASDHGPASDWSAGYQGNVTFGGVEFDTDYYVLDGNTSPGYGFVASGVISTSVLDFGDYSTNSNNITVRSLTANCNGAASRRGVYIVNSDSITLDNVEVWNCDNDPFGVRNVSNLTLNNVYLHTRNNAGVGTHGDAIEITSSSNVIIKNSRFDWNGQQIFFGGDTAGSNGRYDIYGNSFYGGESSGQGICRNSSGTGGPIYVYNNTFYKLNTAIIEGGMNYAAIKNNIFIAGNATSVPTSGLDYNYYSTNMSAYSSDPHYQRGGDPFVNSSGDDFHLANATEKGDASIASMYKIDPDYNNRGADGIIDRGAFEYVNGASTTTTPNAPSNLRIVSSN